MTAKVGTTSTVEPCTVEMSGTTMTPASSAGTQKVSMFAAKAGFVIPKNKLSGSLVPVFRGSKNLGTGDAVSGESKKQIQRKTKWGPDLTQDASVKKGRALAYLTRVEQITQQLKSGVLEDENDEDSLSAPQDPHHKSSKHQIDTKDVDQLELEKREAMGEILKLNPSYKAPPDYKPLLKEATVPIPVKEYPKYNFVGLICGPGSDNQKQLERETGAKIQVYGTKAGTGQKAEIKPSDGSEIHGEYENLYVHISADTFEKVDAAVAVIELLVTSVSGNLAAVSTGASVSGDNAHVPSQVQDTITSNMVPTTVVNQGMVQPLPGLAQTPLDGQFQYPGPFFSRCPSSAPMNMPGFTPLNSSRPVLNNPSHLSTSPFNPAYLPSSFGLLPSLVSPRQNPPTTQFLLHAYMGPQPASVQANVSAPLTFIGNRPLPAGSSTGWSSSPPAPQPGVASMLPPSNIPTANMESSVNHPIAAPSFISIPRPQAGLPSTSLQARVPGSVSGSVPNFAPLKPPMMTAQSPGDFTFQPHRPQNPSFQTVPQPSSHFSAHNASLARPMLPSPAPQAPSFQFPQPGGQVLSRPQLGDHMGQHPSAHMSAAPIARNSTAISVSPRLATFLESSTVLPQTPHPPMRLSNFNPPHQMPNLPGPLSPRPGNYIQIQQNYPAHATRPEIPRAPNQQLSNHLAFSFGKSASGPGGGQQLYDPFSPTSANQQQGGNPGKM
ncbi:LOW QUALITY PROTEIN: branchpoint-bridging protein-like [Pyrus x bretschneideri]|uniref:LOW QUALITY PROTEIN: branchpoint-bridging protein-like n=1 Tax=Pyrus x bretschneideri TaxID=225117 RepID=UPI00202E3EF2|nr:LOW QUALITY PROTEIN: branchpoint-bridging protein-like [Pyrus x bretschneideri]